MYTFIHRMLCDEERQKKKPPAKRTFLYNVSASQSRITMFFRLASTSISFFLIRTSETRPGWWWK